MGVAQWLSLSQSRREVSVDRKQGWISAQREFYSFITWSWWRGGNGEDDCWQRKGFWMRMGTSSPWNLKVHLLCSKCQRAPSRLAPKLPNPQLNLTLIGEMVMTKMKQSFHRMTLYSLVRNLDQAGAAKDYVQCFGFDFKGGELRIKTRCLGYSLNISDGSWRFACGVVHVVANNWMCAQWVCSAHMLSIKSPRSCQRKLSIGIWHQWHLTICMTG